MAGGLRYETGREMPPGMQEIYGVKLAGQMRADASIGPCEGERIATPAPPARNDNEGGADMPDEELLKELQDRAMNVSYDTRVLIDEIIKRYKILKFQLQAQRMKGGGAGEGGRQGTG